MTTDEDVLREQIAYYRARAPEYDEWFLRQGMCDLGPEWNERWNTGVDQVAAELDAFAPTGRVLELACGTGWWTQRLAKHASTLKLGWAIDVRTTGYFLYYGRGGRG